MFNEQYPSTLREVGMDLELPVKDILEKRKNKLLEQVSNIDVALNAIEKVPGLLDALTALRKVGI